jgi:hypothetical protein
MKTKLQQDNEALLTNLNMLIIRAVPQYEDDYQWQGSFNTACSLERIKNFSCSLGFYEFKDQETEVFLKGSIAKQELVLVFDDFEVDFYFFHAVVSKAAKSVSEGYLVAPVIEGDIQGPILYSILLSALSSLHRTCGAQWKMGVIDFYEYVREHIEELEADKSQKGGA